MFLFVCFWIFSFEEKPGTREIHPKITYQSCTKAGCRNLQGGIVVDTELREIVDDNGNLCFNGEWDTSICSDGSECSRICSVNGFNYSSRGIETSGSSVKLPFITPSGALGSRAYLFDETEGKYALFKMLNREFSFDVETSTLGCGMNGALYFIEMEADGGLSKYPHNTAGANYGTGYCDAQCASKGRFVGNNANINGEFGSCCFEWDLWEANALATQFAAHPCSVDGPAVVCNNKDDNCHQCDTSGCAWNHYRTGDQSYYGPGLKVNTNQKFTVVTQFLTNNGLDNGTLSEVRRLYVQGGKVIENNRFISGGNSQISFDSIQDDYCTLTDKAYQTRGGDLDTGKSLDRGQVLAMSIWTNSDCMSWLNSGDAGPCNDCTTKEQVVAENQGAFLEFSNIKYGQIDTTF